MAEPAPNRAHGGYIAATGAQPVLDLSTCVDAFGLFAPLQQALNHVNETASYATYPDPSARLARQSIAAWCDVSASQIDVGPGAAEIIWTFVRSCVRPAERVLIWGPCFSEFAHAAHAVSATVLTHCSANDEAAVDARIHEFARAVGAHAPTAVYLCAPSTPRGEWLPAELLRRVVSQHPNTWFVVDQSYLNMSHHASELCLQFPSNAVLLRSITKELGVPGVRAGYAVMSANLRATLQSQRPYWTLGAHAHAVLQSYTACQPLITQRRELLLAQARVFSEALAKLRWQPELFDTPYFTVRAPEHSPWTAYDVAARLLLCHIAVRDCSSFGLPHHVRVTAHPDQARLVGALTRM